MNGDAESGEAYEWTRGSSRGNGLCFFSGKVHGEAYSYEAQMIMYLNYLSTCGVMNEYISLLSSLLWAARLQAS